MHAGIRDGDRPCWALEAGVAAALTVGGRAQSALVADLAGYPEVRLDLNNIQGNLVPGFNKDHQAFVLVRFRASEQGRKWLAGLQPEIASANEVEAFKVAFKSMRERRAPEPADRDGGSLNAISATWINLAISFAGLRLLPGVTSETHFPRGFRANTVPAADPTAVPGDVHAMLIVAADHAPDLDAELEKQRQRMTTCGVDEVIVFRGATLPGDQRGREHFGFKDGISQPNISGTTSGNGPEVAAGEFILGQPDQTGQTSGKGLPPWTQNGSFLAFVQLEQHVTTFWSTMRQHAQQFGVAPEDLAAWIVGRKHDADGTLVVDPPARLSHVGRGFARWLPPSESLRHRIIRRGIPYGGPRKEGEPDDGQRGLLFVSYQADIERQFELVWTQWLNAPGFPMPGAGPDALVGQLNWPKQSTPNGPRPAAASRPDQRGGTVSLSLPAFVTPRYGAYFFAPAIDALSHLASDSRLSA
jgi:Dyp-type peroxidase family